jgi:Tol biopolymer transport system component
MRNRSWLALLLVVLVGPGVAAPVAASDQPENGQITFARFDPALGDFSIWAANPNGSHQRRLTHVPSFFSDWKPNGRRIAFDFVDVSGGVHIATMDPIGGHVRQLTFANALQEVPKWSPHGQWITYDASPDFPDEPGFHTDIWIIRADGSDARQLTSGGFDVEPVFSPHGSRIAFGRITGVNYQGFQMEAIFMVNTDGTHLRQVVPPLPGLEHPDWSPNGRWIIFNTEPETPNAAIMAVHPNGRDLHVLKRSNDRFEFFKPVWSPNGRKILVGCFDVRAEIDKLCVMNADGQNVHVVIDATPNPVNFPAWGSHPPKH